MSPSTMPQRGTRVLSTLAAIVVVVAGVKAAADIVNPFLLACFAAVMVAPLMTWFMRRGLPRGVALTLVLAVLIGGAVLLGRVLSASVTSFQRQLPFYEQRLESELGGLVSTLEVWLEDLGLLDAGEAAPVGSPVGAGPERAEPGQGPEPLGGALPNPDGSSADGSGGVSVAPPGAGSRAGVDLNSIDAEQAADALVEVLLGADVAEGGAAAGGSGQAADDAAGTGDAGSGSGEGEAAMATATATGDASSGATESADGGAAGSSSQGSGTADGETVAEELGTSLRQALRTQLLEILDPGVVFVFLRKLLAALGGMLGNGLVILLMIAFLLAEGSTFPRKLRLISRDPVAASGRWRAIGDDINHYMAIKTGTSLVTGLVIALWLMFVGVDFPLLWGTLAFLLNYVPNLGSILAALPAVLLAFVQLGPGAAGLAVLGYGVVNFLVGSVLEPRSMGRSLGLSTLVVFLSLVFWGWVLGPIGMLLSVPLTMAVKIALEAADDTRWIGVLLGSEKALLAHVLQDAGQRAGAGAASTAARVTPGSDTGAVRDGDAADPVSNDQRPQRDVSRGSRPGAQAGAGQAEGGGAGSTSRRRKGRRKR